MALKMQVKTLEEVPEALREHYAEQEGVFVLQTDAEDRLKEFRANNIALRQETQTLKQQMEEAQGKLKAFEGVDVDEYTKLKGLQKQLENQELIKEGDLEKLLANTKEELKKEYGGRIQALETKLKTTEDDLHRTRITDALTKSAVSAGVDPDVLEDAVFLASREWQLEEGKAVRKVDDEVVLSQDNAGKNQTMEEYWQEVSQKKPKFFLPSGGGGGRQPGGPGGNAPTVIPNDPVSIGANAEKIAKGEAVVEGTV